MLLFTHADDPARTATYEITSESPAVVVVQHTDAKGKTRKKTIKKGQLWQAQDAAIRFLLNKERYVLRAPQDGPVSWMARLMLDGYVGEIGHAVDPATGVVWVLDGMDQVHRITPETCATVSVRLGSGNRSPGGRVAIGPDGSAWCVAKSWDRVDDGLVRHLRVYRIEGTDSLTASLVADVVGATIIDNLSATADGRALGPAVGGAALYRPDGTVERTFVCSRGVASDGEGQPAAAVSASGAWVACSHGDKVVREHLPTGEVTELQADFKGFNDVHVTDDGTVYVSGFRYPSHGLWVLGEGDPDRVSDDIRATVSADGTQLVSAKYRQVEWVDPQQTSGDGMELRHVRARTSLPVLGMAKYGRAAFGAGSEVAVLTDAYTVAAIDLEQLDPVP